MKRVMFVDDEPRVLRGLERMLFGKRGQWDLAFEASGAHALAAMDIRPADVVVSDIHMPEMGGAELLAQVKAKHPSTIRIVLSGHTDGDAVLVALPVAHRFMSKPCDATIVTETVQQAMDLQDLLSSELIRSIVGRMDQLPITPHLYTELARVLSNPDGSLDDVVELVEQDVAMTGKILHLVNTAFFGQPQRTTSIKTAVSLLGTNMLRNLVLTAELFESFPLDKSVSAHFSIETFQKHCSFVGRIASRLEPKAPWAQDAFTAGMLHDAGKLVLAAKMPAEFVAIHQAAEREGRPVYEIEQEQLGLTHAEIGGYLLGLWGLPHSVIEAVTYHHTQDRIQVRALGAAHAVFAANHLSHESEGENASEALSTNELIAPRLDDWRTTATECMAAPQ